MDNTLEKIYQAGLKFLEPLTPEETYSTIVNEAIKLVRGEHGAITLVSLSGELFRVYASSPHLYKIKIRPRGITYNVYKTHKPVILTASEIAKIHPEIEETDLRSDILVPLFYKRESIGVLSILSNKNKNFTQDDFRILQLFSQMATLAIRKTQLYSETRQALEMRDDFISMASHELRTPLTAISGYVQLLQNKFPLNGQAETRWISDLSGETFRLADLVNELIEVYRLESGRLSFEWKECSPRKITYESVRGFTRSNPNRKIDIQDKINFEKDLIVADPVKLKKAFTNLLDNATSFSDQDTPIIIGLKYSSPCFIVTITDQGKGIPKEELPHIFDRFYRGSGNNHKGMGLGLYLAKDIIEKHKGSIKVQSKVNKGTVVTVKLLKASHV